MNSAIKHSAENNLHLRVMTAKAKIIARAEETAREFDEAFPDSTTDHKEYFIAEAEAKANAKTEKENIAEHVPSWMTASRWTTGERRKAAKLKAYGEQRVTRTSAYEKDRHAHEEHRHFNSDKSDWYIKNGDFHKDPRPTWTKAERRSA